MMLGVRPRSVIALERPVVSGTEVLAVPQPGRDPDAAEEAPCGVLGIAVPLTSPAGPGAIGVPPGPTRWLGTLELAGPGATAVPPGPLAPLLSVELAGPDPLLVPGATAEGAVPPVLEPAPPVPEPAPPAPEPPPPVWATVTSVDEARKRAATAARDVR